MIVNLTRWITETWGGFCFETYVSLPAWRAFCYVTDCRTNAEAALRLFESLSNAQESLPPNPIIPFQIGDADNGVRLQVAYGPNGKDCACKIVMLDAEIPWVKPRFPLGQVIVSQDAQEALGCRYINAALGRHVADDRPLGVVMTIAELLHVKETENEIVSVYYMPSPGELPVKVATNLSRSETEVTMAW